MARRKIFNLNHDSTMRAVEFENPAVVRIRRKAIGPLLDHGRMNLLGILFIDEATLLIALPCRNEIPSATITAPHLTIQIDIEIFSNLPFHLLTL
jgi:hypothetical protein